MSVFKNDAPVPRRRVLLQGIGATLGASAVFRAAAAENGVTDKEILLGQSTALSGPLLEVARPFNEAAIGYFNFVNQQGGVNGRRIKLVTRDDGYVAAKTADNVKDLIENDKVLAIFGVLGVLNTVAALPVATAAKTPFLFPMNGDAAIRRTPNRYFFTVTASFEDEIDKLVGHVATIGTKNVSVAHLKNPFGVAIRQATERALAARGLKLHSSVEFDLQGDKTKAATELLATKPDAVILGAVGTNAADFIRAFRDGGSAAMLLAFSGVGTDILFKQLGEKSNGIIVSQLVPFPWTAAIPLVREYQAVSKSRNSSDFTHLGLWGHVSARMMVESLKRTGRDLTREHLMDAIEGIKSMDLGNYMVEFGPDKHHGSRFVDITLMGRNGKLVK
jgi:ABC-type branched-subunit amino acid transport system substrate-binding protein